MPLSYIMVSTLRLIGHKIWCRGTGDASEPQRQHLESLEDYTELHHVHMSCKVLSVYC
jgi:hypothetical protein